MTDKASPQDRTPPPPYTLTYSSLADPNGTPEGGDYLALLRIAGQSRRAVVQIVRRHNDAAGPMGLFGDVLSESQIRAIPDAIASIQWGSLPPLTGGELDAPQLTLEYALGQKIIRRAFNATNGAFITAIDPIISILRGLMASLQQKPQRAISLSAARTAKGFRVTWRNLGTGPVMLADPREKAQDGSTRGVALFREKAPPGGVVGWWNPIPLAPAAPSLSPVLLGPGETLELDSVAWTPPGPGDYAASASWIDPNGPIVVEKDVMPRMPKPDEMNDARPFVLRGGLFATGLMFHVDKAR